MERNSRLVPLGRLLVGAGVSLILLRGIELFARMPGLPAFWYSNQAIWILVAIGLAALGWNILWGRRMFVEETWQPAIPGRRFQSATIYTSAGCHLCEDAAALIAEHHRWLPIPDYVDIKSDPTLSEKYGTCVPVVIFDGKVRFRGRVDPVLLRRLIEGTPPLPVH
ncbi:glutaredoxin family protein [Schlesneria sp. T3-172]|uniref:glutaredoxin family protein n=1 Tax=Schlesneria sphaerica TaxID=3373610 RepID=UPI0037C774A0